MNNFHKIEPPRVSEVAMTLIRKTIWQRLSNKSVVTGLWLRTYEHTPLYANCFLHVLPIVKYPYFKYFFGNIILVTPGEHGLWSQGSEEDRIQYALDLEEKSRGKSTADWKAVKQLESELLIQYKKSFPVTYKGMIGYSYTLDQQKLIVGRLNKEFWHSFK
jgi:hypothetical protein